MPLLSGLSERMQNALINIVTIMLGLSVGAKLAAEKFLTGETLDILILGMVAFGVGTTFQSLKDSNSGEIEGIHE